MILILPSQNSYPIIPSFHSHHTTSIPSLPFLHSTNHTTILPSHQYFSFTLITSFPSHYTHQYFHHNFPILSIPSFCSYPITHTITALPSHHSHPVPYFHHIHHSPHIRALLLYSEPIILTLLISPHYSHSITPST